MSGTAHSLNDLLSQAWSSHQAGSYFHAEQLYRQVLAASPHSADVWYHLGMACMAQDKPGDAEAALGRAVQLRPDHPSARQDLGIALAKQGKFAEAGSEFEQFVRAQPNNPDAHHNLAMALSDQGLFADALMRCDKALTLDVRHAGARWLRSMLWLRNGDFSRGWREYEWRPTSIMARRRFLFQPLWDGSPLPGGTILLETEQGIGDALQFIRFADLVKQRCGTVIVECLPMLAPLLATAPGVDFTTPADAPLPPFAVHAPLLSLPGILQTSLANLPATVPYLRADAVLMERWQREFVTGNQTCKESTSPTKRIGIAWRGSPTFRSDEQRSAPLTQFLRLSQVPGVKLYSFQVGPGTDQLTALADRHHINDLASRFDPRSFADAAAAVMQMDLIITVDTALAHLAGALARPVWVILPYASDWRWLLQRDDSPWYPTMRLFRQTEAGRWDDVFERVATALKSLRS